MGTLKTIWNFVTAKWLPLLAVAAAAYIGFLRIQNEHLRDQLRTAGLEILNDSARADSTHQLVMAQQDSIQAWTRLAVQEKQRADSLDKRLKQEVRSKVALRLRVDSLKTVLAGAPTTENAQGVRKGVFDGYQKPYQIHAEALLPAPPAEGALQLTITLDDLNIRVRAQCGPVNANHVRPAQILVETPTWVQLRIDEVTQTPEVCMPQMAPQSSGTKTFLKGAGAGAGAILLLHFFIGVP